MNIITLLWWSLGRGNPVVPSRWQATAQRSDDRVRGSKNLWRVFITVNPGNSIVYWLAGRK